MASITTVLALVAFSCEQEFLTQRAKNRLIELPLDEFVTVHFKDISTPLSHGPLTTKTADLVQRSLLDILLDCSGVIGLGKLILDDIQMFR